MNDFLLSKRAQKLLTVVQSLDKLLRILTLVPVAALAIADNMYTLLDQSVLIHGFIIIGVALVIGGVIDFLYVYHVEECQPLTRKVSVCCYGALIATIFATALTCSGLYTVITSILTEHDAFQVAIDAYGSHTNPYMGGTVVVNAMRFTPILGNDINMTALELLLEVREFHRLIWLMSCTLFGVAHAAVTALNVVLTELTYKAQNKAWRVLPPHK